MMIVIIEMVMECEMLKAGGVGKFFLEVFRQRTNDDISDTVISFYKAKRAFLCARRSIQHLQESSYWQDKNKWVNRANNYLRAAKIYTGKLPL